MYTLLRNKRRPDMEDIDTYFQGNLCRCLSAHQASFAGAPATAQSWRASGRSPMTTGRLTRCLLRVGVVGRRTAAGAPSYHHPPPGTIPRARRAPHPKTASPLASLPIAPHRNPSSPRPYSWIHLAWTPSTWCSADQGGPPPPDLLLPRVAWYRPTSLQQLLALRHQHPGAKVVVGNTELGVEVKFKHCDYPVYLSPTAVEDMARVGTEFLHLNFVFPDHRD